MASRPAIALLGVLLVLGQSPRGQAQEHIEWRHFTNRNGLPQSSVSDMAWDRQGNLWLTTQGGLARCDGRFMRPVALKAASSSRQLVHLLRTVGGSVLTVDASGAAHRLHDGAPLPLPAAGEDPRVPTGTVPTERQLGFLLRLCYDQEGPDALVAAQDSTRWLMAQQRRLTWFRDTATVGSTMLPAPAVALFTLADAVHVVGDDGAVFRCDPAPGSLRPVAVPPEVAVKGRWFAQAGGDHVLFLAEDGLYAIRRTGPEALEARAVNVVLPSHGDITHILLDEGSGVLAVSTLTQGLFLYRPKWFSNLQCTDPGSVPDNAFYAQAELADGRIFTADHKGRGVVFTNGVCSEAPDPLKRLDPFSMAKDAAGVLYYTDVNGIRRYDPAAERSTTLVNSGEARAIMVLEQDTLWALSRVAFGWVGGDTLHLEVALDDADPEHDPVTLSRAPDGRWWYGHTEGAFILGHGAVQRPAPVEGLRGANVRALRRLGGVMLIGTYGQGAFVHDGRALRRLPLDERGALLHTHAFAPDAYGGIWVSTNNGLLRTTQRDLMAWVADSTQRPYFARYDEEDGLAGSELNGGCRPPFLTLASGRLSFPSMRGLLQFDPAAIPDPWPAAGIRPTVLQVDGVAIPLADRTVLPVDHREVVLQYALTYWGNAANVQLEHRLEGVRNNWSPLPSDRSEIQLGLLPPGEVRLVVRKVGGPLRGEPEAFSIVLSVPLPWYRTWWAGLSFVVLAALIGLLLHRWRVTWLHASNARLASLVDERTRALSEANSGLTAALHHQEKLIAIIAHDVVHPLRFVSRVARDARAMHQRGEDPGELGLTLDDLEGATRKLFTNASDLLGWVRSRHAQEPDRRVSVDLQQCVDTAFDRIAELSGTTERCNAVPPGTRVTTDPDVLAIVLNNLLMNAVLHGKARRITVALAEDPGTVLRVDDDGTGMSTEQLDRVRKELEGAAEGQGRAGGTAIGLGYVIIAECLRLLRARAEIRSDERGTAIEIALPSA
ncbi:MAG: HAMP domain-containing histidine kinase [Flavobacteriales bacterium]|nr:hypothetical protein [Flavobacteriales bacterium]MCC6577109.1 HAMP domain-containing histidine kinase [Flavobacteriales bacterium]NUQ15578.1 HAMP domain-containing histidine kinase [Flavobacteriales bacterium]